MEYLDFIENLNYSLKEKELEEERIFIQENRIPIKRKRKSSDQEK